MDLLTLKVYNSLQKLGLKEKDFEVIQIELKNEVATGLYVQKVVKYSQEKFAVCVDYDEKDILIKRVSKGIKPKNKSRILFNTLVTFTEIPKEVFILNKLSGEDEDIKYVANNLEELKDRITFKLTELGGKKEGNLNREQQAKKRKITAQEQIRAFYKLFGEEYDGKDMPSRVNVPRIIKVFQRNNQRLAIIKSREEWVDIQGLFRRKMYEENYYVATFQPSDKMYNYVSPNREFVWINDEKGEVWLDDDVFEQVIPNEMYQYCKQVESPVLMTAELYNEVKGQIRTALTIQQREKEEQQAKEIMSEKVEKQFKKGSVTRCGIKFTKGSITYEGIKIKSDKIGNFLISDNKLQLDEIDFNELYKDLIDYIVGIYYNYDCYPPDIHINFDRGDIKTIKIGQINVKIERVVKRGFLINGFRISKFEVAEAVRNTINYRTQEDYDKWLDFTSKVNIRFQKALKKGFLEFKLPVKDQEDNDINDYYGGNYDRLNTIDLIIPIAREGDNNFIVLKDKKLKIKNIHSFLSLEDCSYVYRYYGGDYIENALNQLSKAISKITTDDMVILIKEGVENLEKKIRKKDEELKQAEEKSKEFLANAIRLTRAILVQGGYIVKGLSGMHYFIEETNAHAYTTKDKKKDKYLCLVDITKESEEAEGQAKVNDQIARRLLMLSKDRKVAKEIYSRGDKLDKWWLEISEKPIGVEI